MRTNVVLSAVAGLASGALGQSGSLSVVASQTVVDSTVTTSITLAVYGETDWGTHITGSSFGLSATGGAGVVDDMSIDSLPSWVTPGAVDLGHAGDGNYAGLASGQIVFLPFLWPDAVTEIGNGPVLLANFSVTIAAGSVGVVEWGLVAVPDLNWWSLEAFDVTTNPNANPPGTHHHFASPDFGLTSVNVIPAPSGLALLGFGGLVAGRRRRL